MLLHKVNDRKNKRASKNGCSVYCREVDQNHGSKASIGATLSLSILFTVQN